MDGNDALLKTTKVTEWKFDKGGSIPIAFGSLLLLGCIAAYVIAVLRGNVDAILPLISDAAGSPPQNGVFGTLICLGGMCGVVFMIQWYMIVLERNRDRSHLVLAMNRLSLLVGIAAMLGITLISGYPINFYRNKDSWFEDVGLPHLIGGVSLFSLGLCYLALQCLLTLFLQKKQDSSSLLSLRVLLLFVCTAAFVYHMITAPEYFEGLSHLYYRNSTGNETNYSGNVPYPRTMGASLRLPIETGGSYVSSAIAEWIFVFFFCCFFFTFSKEAQEFSLVIVIETHTSRTKETLEQPDFRKMSLNGNQVVSKPPPEVRKVLRRDSTCQTITEGQTEIMPSKKGYSQKSVLKMNGSNEKKDTSSGPEVDKKLKQLLQKCEGAATQTNISVCMHTGSATGKEGPKKPVTDAGQQGTNGLPTGTRRAPATDENSEQSTCPMSVQ